MNQLNSVIIEGNVVKEPFFSEPVSGFRVADFSIGVNRSFKGKNGEWKEEVSYVNVQTLNKLADLAREKALKGRAIRVVGRLKQDRWKNDQGNWESKMIVVAEHIEFKPVKSNGSNQEIKSSKINDDSELTAMKLAEQAAANQMEENNEVVF